MYIQLLLSGNDFLKLVGGCMKESYLFCPLFWATLTSTRYLTILVQWKMQNPLIYFLCLSHDLKGLKSYLALPSSVSSQFQESC